MTYSQLRELYSIAGTEPKSYCLDKMDVCVNTFIKPGRALLRPQVEPISKRVYGVAFDVCPAVHKQLLACRNNRDNGEQFNAIMQGLAIDVTPDFERLTGISLTVTNPTSLNEPQQCQ